MAWRNEEALLRLLETIQIARDIYGAEDVIRILQQELARERVIDKLGAQKKQLIAVAGAHGALQAQLDTATAALEFYAETDNYRAGPGGKVSAVAKDKGREARNALEEIGGEAGEPDENEGDE